MLMQESGSSSRTELVTSGGVDNDVDGSGSPLLLFMRSF